MPENQENEILKNKVLLSTFKAVAVTATDSKAASFSKHSRNTICVGPSTVYYRTIVFSDTTFFYTQLKGDQQEFKKWLDNILRIKYDRTGN